jgi:hypothetical protein
MSHTVHCCLDIRGALRPGQHVRGMLRDPQTGRVLPAREVREWLMDRLAEGKRVLPFGEPCEGFSFQTGCPGHEDEAGGGR